MNGSRMSENEMMQTSEVIEQSIKNVDESQIINALRNISELEITEFRHSFE